MSKRRHKGELVWLKPCSGFVVNSHIAKVEITEWTGGCFIECGDRACQEWDVLTEADAEGNRYPMFHVSECQMLDEPWKGESPT